MKLTCPVIAFLFLSCVFFGRPHFSMASGSSKSDSLQKLLFKSDETEEKIRLYLALARAYQYDHRDSTDYCIKAALNLARTLNADKFLGDVYSAQGNLAVIDNKLDEASKLYNLAAKHYIEVNEIEKYAKMYQLIGNILTVTDNLPDAMTHYMVAQELAEKGHYVSILPHIYNNMGLIYKESEDYRNALTCFNKSYKVFLEIKDIPNSGNPLMNIGLVYFMLGDLGQASNYTNRALEIFRKSGEDISEAECLADLGQIKNQLGQYEEAIELLNQGLALIDKSNSKYLGPKNIIRSELLIRTGMNYLDMGNFIVAKSFLFRGYKLARIMSQPKMVISAAENLSKLYKKSGRSDSALFYYEIFHEQSDSLSKMMTVRTIKLNEIRKEYDKKQKENEMRLSFEASSRKTILILYIISGAALLAVVFILFLMLRLEKQKKKQGDLEKQALNEKLEYQNKELTTNVMYLTKMNEMVVQIGEKMKRLEVEDHSSNAKIIKLIISELEQTANVDAWKEFEIRFQNVHTHFYHNLSDKFPDLSPNELKLCAFLRLNMSTKEISSLTYQSQNSIMVARSRLRQKIGISKDENLITFLSQF